MAIGSGLGGQCGIAPETTYGTAVAPTQFLEVESAPFELAREYTDTAGIAAGRTGKQFSRRQPTTRQASGSIALEVATSKMGLLFQHLMGPTVTPTVSGTGFLQRHVLGDSLGKSLTVQLGIPRTTGVVDAYTYTGAKVTKAEFSAGVGESLKASFEFDSRDQVTQTLAAASIPTLKPFHWAQATLKLGSSVATVAAVDGVTEVSLSIERAMKTDRFYMGNSGVKAEPITNDLIEVTGSITADNVDKATFVDRFLNNDGFALVWEFLGAQIGAGPTRETLRFELPKVALDGGLPQLEGLDVVSGSFPFTAYVEAGSPHAAIDYITTDSTI